MALELSELARKEIITSKSDIIDMRKALYDKLKRANKKAAGFPSSIGGVDTMFFDKKHTGPPAFEVVNLVVGVTLYIFAAPGNRPVLLITQPQTRKLQQVCCRLVALLSSSRYQDAFASLAPA